MNRLVDVPHAIELTGIDVDVDDPGVWRKLCWVGAGDAIVEACSEDDQHVAPVGGQVGNDGSVHAKHAQPKARISGPDTLGVDACGNRNPIGLTELGDLRACLRDHGAVTHVEERPLGRRD